MQNYESIKQRMLTSGGTEDFFDALKRKQHKALEDSKLSGFGFLAGMQLSKKRKRDQISNENPLGRFLYKFKEGHSKNFKRELGFDYFIA